jgi:hypothetical protein
MLAAKTRHLPRTRNPLDRREKPQSQQDARIRRRMAGPPLKGFDRAEQRGQVQAFDKTPDRTHAMIVRHEFLQADRTPLDLAPLRRAKPRHRLANPLRRGLRGQRFEKLLVLVPSHR